MTEDARKVFDKRYVNDIEKAKIKPIHSYGMAARIKKSVENGIAVSEKKGAALKALQKTEALRLYKNNRIFHKFDNHEVCNYLKRIVDLDFENISNFIVKLICNMFYISAVQFIHTVFRQIVL